MDSPPDSLTPDSPLKADENGALLDLDAHSADDHHADDQPADDHSADDHHADDQPAADHSADDHHADDQPADDHIHQDGEDNVAEEVVAKPIKKHHNSNKQTPKKKSTPARNPNRKGSDDFSPQITQHAASMKRSGTVFDSLYQDAISRRERRKQHIEQVEAERVQARSPEVSKLAARTTRSRNVFEALYADATARKESRKKRQDEGS